MKNAATAILKETLIQMVISIILVAVMAFIMLKVSPAESVLKIMVLIIYGISSFAGGMILGKVMNRRKFLWGAAAGAVYIGIILLAALIVKGGIGGSAIDTTTGIIVSLAAGTAGGMLG